MQLWVFFVRIIYYILRFCKLGRPDPVGYEHFKETKNIF